MEQPVDKNLLQKFLNNTCTADELVSVRELLNQPGSDELLHQVMQEESSDLWNDPTKTIDIDEDRSLDWNNRVHQRMAAAEQPKNNIRKLSFLKYAAVWAGIIVTIGGFGWYRLKKQQVPMAVVMLESHTQTGKLVRLQLSDSTIVYLNALSSIKYPENFTGKLREVELKGEAFFEVKHDSKHPFIIHTDNLKVQVLGTSFNIKSYGNDKEVAVTVATGKVGVSIPSLKNVKAEILLPNKQFTYNKISNKFNVLAVDAEESKSWETGLFIFNYETLENITKRLARWYGMSFIIKRKSLMEQKYKLKQKNVDINTVMQSLSSADQGFYYEIKNKEIVIW